MIVHECFVWQDNEEWLNFVDETGEAHLTDKATVEAERTISERG